MRALMMLTAAVSLSVAAEVTNVLDRTVAIRERNADPAKIGDYTLEDPLTFLDGRKVATKADWAKRRKEILGIFAREMYGEEPPRPEAVVTELVGEKTTAAGLRRIGRGRRSTGPCGRRGMRRDECRSSCSSTTAATTSS